MTTTLYAGRHDRSGLGRDGPRALAGPAAAGYDRAFFGHPRGLSTLFFTEMWERFSYYGMRALLILFMTAPLAAGGLGFDTATAGAIYGLYTSMVYMTTLPGGWIADRLIGQRRAVLYGGILIACGHFSMAFPSLTTFYLGLVADRPRHRPAEGQRQRHRRPACTAEGRSRRDAGFSIFYMGINLGAFIAPLVCGYLGQRVNWHLGFAAAGVGMVLGLDAVRARRPSTSATPACIRRRRHRPQAAATLQRRVAIWRRRRWSLRRRCSASASYTGALPITATQVADAAGYPAARHRRRLLRLAVPRAATGRRRSASRLYVIGVLFLAAALFWSVFEQAGSTLNLFADRNTRNVDVRLGVPEQLVPVAELAVHHHLRAGVRLALAAARRSGTSRRARRSSRIGLIFVGAGFAMLIVAAQLAEQRRAGQPDVADRHLPAAHLRRAVRSARSA